MDEVKNWGVTATCICPVDNNSPSTQAPTRLNYADIAKVGEAQIFTSPRIGG